MYRDKRKCSKIMFKTIVSRDKGCKNEPLQMSFIIWNAFWDNYLSQNYFSLSEVKLLEKKMNWQFQTKTWERKLLKNYLFSPRFNIICSIRNFVESAVIV